MAPEVTLAQKANAQIIGYGSQSILDADEPQLSGNLNYLTQTAIRMARGDADKAPAQLETMVLDFRVLM